MYTQYDFPEMFRKKLYQKAVFLVEKNTDPLEKRLLEQFDLLTQLTSLEWEPSSKEQKIGIFIGAAEGLDNVHEAFFLAKEIKNFRNKNEIKMITSGAIGVTMGKSKDMGVPGVNGRVMAQLLYEYGLKPADVITEDRSLNTDMQALEIQKIIKAEKFNTIICVSDYWHQARLLMTFIGRNPAYLWHTHTVEADKDNINSAVFDWGQRIFQTPLLIAEIARIHHYVEKKMGPCDLNGLCEYLSVYHPHKLNGFIKEKKLARLKFLWDRDHKDIISDFDKFSKYR